MILIPIGELSWTELNPSSLRKRFHWEDFTVFHHSAWICLPRWRLSFSFKTVRALFNFALCNWQVPDPVRFFLKKMFQSWLVSHLKWISYYVSEALFRKPPAWLNLYYLCFHYYLLDFWVFCRDCSPNLVGFFANIALCFKKKNKNVIHQPSSVRIGKNCALCLAYRPRPTASGGTHDLGYSFSQYGPPAWWITYIYFFLIAFLGHHTARHLSQRVPEHKNSTISKHYHEAHGRWDLLNESHFKIMRKCQGKFDCLMYEMFNIKKFKPNLNVQPDSIRAKLFV